MGTTREHLQAEWKQIELATRVAELALVNDLSSQQVMLRLGLGRTQYFAFLKKAREMHLVQCNFRWEKHGDDIKTSLSLGQQLQAKYPQLDNALVAELPPQLSCYRGYSPEYDKSLHNCLAKVGAGYLRGAIRPGDHIGVGDGQEVMSLASHLIQDAYFRPRERHQVSSLCAAKLGRDDSANMIAVNLGYAIALDRAEGRYKINLYPSPLPDVPDMAVFGLKHDVPRFAFPELANYHGVDHVKSGGYYYPLLECLNRISLVPPPDGLRSVIDERMQEEWKNRILELNQDGVSINTDDLCQIPIRIGIAGGLHKVFQIDHAIGQGLVNHLVIDALTAEALLRLN